MGSVILEVLSQMMARTYGGYGNLYLLSATKELCCKWLSVLGGHWQIEKGEYIFSLNQA